MPDVGRTRGPSRSAIARAAALGTLLAVLLGACARTEPPADGGPGAGSAPFALAALTPPIGSGRGGIHAVEVRGDSVLLTSGSTLHVSFDRRRSWKAIDVGGLGGVRAFAFATDTAGVARTGGRGLVYLDLEEQVVWYLDREPVVDDWALRGDGALYAVGQEIDPGGPEGGDETSVATLYRASGLTDPAGETWSATPLPALPFRHRTFTPSVHFGSDGSIWVASHFGLQVTHDEGASWRSVPVLEGVGGALDWSGVGIFVTRSGTIFATTSNASFVSRDGGATYTEAAYPGGIADRDLMPGLYEGEDGRLYAEGSSYRSSDEGRTWEPAFDADAWNDGGVLEGAWFRNGEFYLDVRFRGAFASVAPYADWEILAPATGDAGFIEAAFPLGDGRVVALWNSGLALHTPGERAWRLGGFFPAAHHLSLLRDGRLVLAERDGLRFSSDGGATWSEAAAPAPGTLDRVGSVLELPDRLMLSGFHTGDCEARPLLESFDGGSSWRDATHPRLLFDRDSNDVTADYDAIEVVSVDRDGVLFGTALNLWVDISRDCIVVASMQVRSSNAGRTWWEFAGPFPRAATSRGDLLTVEGSGSTEEALLWRAASGKWSPLGRPELDGVGTDLLFYAHPFVHVDGADHAYFTAAGRVLRSERPLR